MSAPLERSVITLSAPAPASGDRFHIRALLGALINRLTHRGAGTPPGSQSVAGVFNAADYAFEKIQIYLSGESDPALALWGSEELMRELARFEGVLVSRGLGDTLFRTFAELLQNAETSLGQMSAYLGGRPSPILGPEGARTVLNRLKDGFAELRSLSNDIDHAYAARWRAPSKISA